MQKSTWGGLGAWTLALATGLISSGWPELIRPHPHFVIGLGIIGLLMFAYPGFKWVYQQQKGFDPHHNPWEGIPIEIASDENTVSSGTNTGNFVGKDNSGPQVSTGGGSIIGDSALKELMRSLPAQPVQSPVNPSVKKRPNLVCLKPKFKRDMGRISGAKQEKLLGVIPIENRLGETIYVDSICASIRFTGNSTEDHYVKKAFWYDKTNYDIDIHAGDVEEVVMGQAIGDRWYYFDNPLRYIPNIRAPLLMA